MGTPRTDCRKVFVYSPVLPAPTGSGAAIRVWTNLRAYLDAGYQPRVTLVGSGAHDPQDSVPGLPIGIQVDRSPATVPGMKSRLAFLLRQPVMWDLDYNYPYRRVLRRLVAVNEARCPGSVHHFEYLDLAVAVIPFLPGTTVFSCHDLESIRTDLIQMMRRRTGAGGVQGWRRALRRRSVRRAERLTVTASDVVLSIAANECDFLRRTWRAENVFLLPLSCPDERPAPRRRAWAEGGTLRLLHIGSLDSYAGFHSLEYLFGSVLPRLPATLLQCLEIEVVGRESDSPMSRRIRALATPFARVRFHGFQDSLDSYYSTSDLQVVATPQATGLRTRMVESFARGVPVLTSGASAQGFSGLAPGENILVADKPEDFRAELQEVLEKPAILQRVSAGGRTLYESDHSRYVAATTLHSVLDVGRGQRHSLSAPREVLHL